MGCLKSFFFCCAPLLPPFGWYTENKLPKVFAAQRRADRADGKQAIGWRCLGCELSRAVLSFGLKERDFSMIKSVFIILMITETLLDLISMGLLFSDMGAAIYPISLAIFAVVLAPFCLWLKKTKEEAKKRKIRLCMVLIMLLPTVAATIAVLYVVTALMLYFG